MIILSYFSLPTDLASAMREWPEFVSGLDYDVALRDSDSGEEVTIRLIESPDEAAYLQITSNQNGRLYEKAVGRAIIELVPHTDVLMVHEGHES